MSVKKTNNRVLIKRSTVSGVVPTIPGSGATNVYDHTEGGWINTDIYQGELFLNVADDKMWFRSTGGTNLIGYSGMTTDFIDLSDTPAAYAGSAGYGLKVNGASDALEFYQLTGYSFAGLPDTPAAYVADSVLISNSALTGLEWTDRNNSFTGLTDTVSTITPNYIVVGGTGATIDMVLGSDIFIDSGTVQTIASAKTFASTTVMSGLTLSNSLIFNGIDITNITTDILLASSSDNQLATSYATKAYIDATIFNTGTTAFVTQTTPQTITGSKTFDAAVIYNSGFTITDLSVSNDFNITGNTYNSLTSEIYYGDETTDGSFKQYIDTNGNYVITKNTGGVYGYGTTFSLHGAGITMGEAAAGTTPGLYALGIGYNTEAQGARSLSVGSVAKSIGTGSFAQGSNVYAEGITSHAIGSHTYASGTSSFAGGNGGISGPIIADGTGAFNFSSSIDGGAGVTANYAAILGGLDNACSHVGSVILGGSGQTSDATNTVYCENLKVENGWSGTFTNGDADIVTVVSGIITNVATP